MVDRHRPTLSASPQGTDRGRRPTPTSSSSLPTTGYTVDARALRHRNAVTPYDGMQLTGRVRRDLLARGARLGRRSTAAEPSSPEGTDMPRRHLHRSPRPRIARPGRQRGQRERRAFRRAREPHQARVRRRTSPESSATRARSTTAGRRAAVANPATTGRSCGSASPGVIHGVVVDTAFFKGNYPPEISVEATSVEGYPSAAELWGSRRGRPSLRALRPRETRPTSTR